MISYRALHYRLSSKLAVLSKREQWILMLVVVVLFTGIIQGLLTLTGFDHPGKIITNQERVERENSVLQSAISEIEQRHNNPEIQRLQKEVERLTIDNNFLQSQIELAANYLIPPEKMASLLRELLLKHPGLRLVNLSTGTPVAKQVTEEASLVYEHSLRLEVTGAFQSVLAWLQDIESLDWVINWDQLQYEMTEWPNGTLNLEIHTLSQNEEFLGV